MPPRAIYAPARQAAVSRRAVLLTVSEALAAPAEAAVSVISRGALICIVGGGFGFMDMDEWFSAAPVAARAFSERSEAGR